MRPIFFLEDVDDKRRAISIIMKHYSDDPYQFPTENINATAVVKIEIDSMTGKTSG